MILEKKANNPLFAEHLLPLVACTYSRHRHRLEENGSRGGRVLISRAISKSHSHWVMIEWHFHSPNGFLQVMLTFVIGKLQYNGHCQLLSGVHIVVPMFHRIVFRAHDLQISQAWIGYVGMERKCRVLSCRTPPPSRIPIFFEHVCLLPSQMLAQTLCNPYRYRMPYPTETK